jgi:hypothetical protein
MFTKMSNPRSSSYPLLNVAEDGVDGVISLDCLVDSWVGMAAGRVVFGSDNTRPDIIPDPYTNIHTHQVNRVKKWTRTRTQRVSIGYRVSGGYGTVKYKSACKLMNNTVYDRCELINNITARGRRRLEAQGQLGGSGMKIEA